MDREVILSPHLDDAVLSCWHRLERPGTQVVTVFAGIPLQHVVSDWDAASGFRTPSEAIHTRRLENLAALRHTPSTAVDLDFVEHAYATNPPDIDQIAESVLRSTSRDAAFVAAAGLSLYLRKTHPDHETTRAVGKRLMDLGRTVLFYADIPYILPRFRYTDWPARLSLDGVKKRLGVDVASEPYELSEEERSRKRQALQAYRSQVPLLLSGYRHALARPEAYRWEVIFRPV